MTTANERKHLKMVIWTVLESRLVLSHFKLSRGNGPHWTNNSNCLDIVCRPGACCTSCSAAKVAGTPGSRGRHRGLQSAGWLPAQAWQESCTGRVGVGLPVLEGEGGCCGGRGWGGRRGDGTDG
jgi:hypothetical protein